MIFGLIGGLGIFLLGMKYMSEGMQAVAGTGLRRMIGMATNNRVLAAIVGLAVTCLVQSSSITTVMVVGFVNSGLMTLMQAIGVIMGSNIGTTITGWILVLKIGKYGLPILGLAAFVYLFAKGDRVRYIAMAIMGMGMVFFGLELMKDACAYIKDLPAFEAWFGRFSADTVLGMLQCMLAGCVLTVMVQSSSATLGITIALALTGVINYPTAAALVLGENIGTTITALLASIGANTNARRAAYFHGLFNLIGVSWISIIFFQYVKFVPWAISADVTQAVIDEEGIKTFPQITAAIAATHSIFNVVNTLLFLPIAHVAARVLARIVPERRAKEKHRLTNLDVRMLETPVVGIEQSRVELLRMAEGCRKMMDWLKASLGEDDPDPKRVKNLFQLEEDLDTIQDEFVTFMTNLLSGNVPHRVIEEGREQLRMADEYESISDCLASVQKFQLRLGNQGFQFDEIQRAELGSLHDSVAQYLDLVFNTYEDRQTELDPSAASLATEIAGQVKTLRNKHISELSKNKVEPFVNLAFTSSLAAYRAVRDHGVNIMEAMSEEI
ncbi:MAG: sodium:phosphate symporter [Planctomycetaceae bacterium]|nr:sodium:phosphate symporter [Planctomycetaceae bacterium]